MINMFISFQANGFNRLDHSVIETTSYSGEDAFSMKPEFYSVPLDVFRLENKNEVWPLKQGCDCVIDKSEKNYHDINQDKSRQRDRDISHDKNKNNIDDHNDSKSQINDINSNDNIDILSVNNVLADSLYNSNSNSNGEIDSNSNINSNSNSKSNINSNINGFNHESNVDNDHNDLDNSLIWKRSDFVLK